MAVGQWLASRSLKLVRFSEFQSLADLQSVSRPEDHLQGEGLISKRYEINSRNPGGASFEKVAKALVRPMIKL